MTKLHGFISYAHHDHGSLAAVRTHLRPLERLFDIDFWADKRIKSGTSWRSEIEGAIARSDVHLLLASPAFFDSDYINDHEIPAIMDRCASGALVIPVILKRCCWEPFLGALQAAPMTSSHTLVPVAEWRPKENGLDAVCKQVMDSIQLHFKLTPKTLDWGRK